MLRTAFRSLAVLAVVGVLLGAQQAQVGLWHRGGGSSGGSWGSSGGSWGSSGGSPVVGPASTPPTPSTTVPEPLDPPPASKKSTYHPTYGPLRNDASLSVKVPADAKVFVNDRPTPSTGADREYISRNLQSGAHYNYAVRVEFIRNGQPVLENKTVQLTAGQSANLDFTQGEARVQTAANPETRTTLIGRVPANAKLYLSSQEMKLSSPVHELPTTYLTTGSQWADDAIRAVIEKDGQQQVREQTVSLKADESREDERRAGAGLRLSGAGAPSLNRRAAFSNWLMMLAFGGAPLVFFGWRRRQAGRTFLGAWSKLPEPIRRAMLALIG
jgi:uncharacterized protein (TIGR03000 family)